MEKKFLEIAEQYCSVKAEDIMPEMRFIEDLEFSSFDFMAFLGELEDAFDIEVEEEEVLKIKTVGEALSYLEKTAA